MKITRTVNITLDDGTAVTLSPAVLLAVNFMVTPRGDCGPAEVEAIRFVRLSCALSLKDAKDVVDALLSNPAYLS